MDRMESMRRQLELARELLDWFEGAGAGVPIDYEAVAQLAELVLETAPRQPAHSDDARPLAALRDARVVSDVRAAA
jgi:hypothetical protein